MSIEGEIKMPDLQPIGVKRDPLDQPFTPFGLAGYAEVSIKKAENGFIISYGYAHTKIATSFDDMVGILKELLK